MKTMENFSHYGQYASQDSKLILPNKSTQYYHYTYLISVFQLSSIKRKDSLFTGSFDVNETKTEF